MAQDNHILSNEYRIRVRGTVHPSLFHWFCEITVLRQEEDATLFVGQFPDQPALRGFLEQLWNLNFTVLSLERVENPNDLDAHQE